MRVTDEQRQKIKELRLNGIGYKAIGTTLGLSRDSVRSYCKRHGLDGDYAVVSLNHKEKINQHVVCTQCQKRIKQQKKGRTRQFCSDACRRLWWKENQQERKMNTTAIYHYTCVYCKETFSVYGNKKRKYCSHNCYIKDRFWRDENGI